MTTHIVRSFILPVGPVGNVFVFVGIFSQHCPKPIRMICPSSTKYASSRVFGLPQVPLSTLRPSSITSRCRVKCHICSGWLLHCWQHHRLQRILLPSSSRVFGSPQVSLSTLEPPSIFYGHWVTFRFYGLFYWCVLSSGRCWQHHRLGRNLLVIGSYKRSCRRRYHRSRSGSHRSPIVIK